jgi:BirA family biotin operon repressor/biotin-[acetyl-CoA-carboxylase] ligase
MVMLYMLITRHQAEEGAGNKWESERGKNLLISIILNPKSILPEDQFYISMAISLGICDFIGLPSI